MNVIASVLAAALVMMAAEMLAPGRRWPHVAGWWGRALALNGVQVVIVIVAGGAWDAWMATPHTVRHWPPGPSSPRTRRRPACSMP